MAAVEVRQADISDVPVVAAINQHVHRLHVAAEPEDFLPATPEQAEPFFADLLTQPSHLLFVARLDNIPAGYIWAEEIRRGANAFKRPSRTLYIHHLAVVAEHRRVGVGRALYARVEQEASGRGIRRLGIDHWSFNSDARRFFEGLGFEVYNVRMRRQSGTESS